MSHTKKKIGVLVSGRGSNLQALIDKLPELPIEIAVVICDQPGAFAVERAARAGITALVIERKDMTKQEFEAALADALREQGAELVVLAGFMRLLGTTFLSRSPGPVINIHPALLPAFPGLHAQAQALKHGVKVSGCTVHFVDEGMDTGPIIAQRAVPVLDTDTEDSLSQRILEQEHLLLPYVVGLLATDRIVLAGNKVIIKGEQV